MRIIGFYLLAAITCLAGCLQQLQVIKLKPDGSGTLEITGAVSQKVAAMMGAPTGSPLLAGKELQKLEQEFKQEATRYGEVTLLSTEMIDTAEYAGVKTIYRFKDITKVKLGDRPDPPPLPQFGGAKTSAPPGVVSFRFATRSDGTKVLTMISPDGPPANPGNRPTKVTAERDVAEINEVLAGMKLAGWIEVAGKVVKTNSPHIEGNKVILYDFDFDQILTDPQGFKKVVEASPQTLQEARASLGDIKGVRITFEPEIVIEFK